MVRFNKQAALDYEMIDPIVIENIKKAMKNPIRAEKGMKLQSIVTFIGDDVEQTVKRHRKEMLMSILFQKGNQLEDTDTGAELYMFSGVKQQLGRIPKISDKFEVYRGKAYMEVITGTGQIVSMFSIKAIPGD